MRITCCRGRAIASPTLERAKYLFKEVPKSAFDPDLLIRELETVSAAARYAERQLTKVLDVQRGVKTDFSLATEPTRWEDTLPEVYLEPGRWKEAANDEIVSTTKFGVYKAIPRSAAGSRRISGCRWVYKRKANKIGGGYRYRARLVAQCSVRGLVLLMTQTKLSTRWFIRTLFFTFC